MKRFKIFTLSVALLAAFAAQAAVSSSSFKARSVLAEGKWVKVGVDKTGVYEITYQTLREMGFSDPAKVAVYGRGGRMLPEDFTDADGNSIMSDDLEQVSIIHDNDRIYFYGLGPEEINFTPDNRYETGGYFKRNSLNIYSKRGYYFLTDSSAPVIMQPAKQEGEAKNVTSGVSYFYHELDSIQNTTDSGQLFWGEFIGLPHLKKRKWEVKMPDALAGKGVMECALYITGAKGGSGRADGTISYGFEGTDFFTTSFVETSATTYRPHNPTVAEITVPGNKGTAFAGFDFDDMVDFSYVDYWVVSYNRAIPTLKGVNSENLGQQHLALPKIEEGTAGTFTLSNCATYKMWEVSDPSNPKTVDIRRSGASGSVTVCNSGKTPEVVVFDTQRPQYQISGYESVYSPVANQNLHSHRDEGADFLIITVPALKEYAEEIADIHRKNDGIKVLVATTEECYNEFSGGVPDAMAYRGLAKMLYHSPVPPKNIMLFGQIYSDFRGVQKEHDPLAGIIAYQSRDISVSRGAYNINDFYGMMDDIIRMDNIERNTVQIGVAIMPIKFESEARIMIDKIRKYVERTDQAYYFNRFTAVGGIGDSHTHDTQVRDMDTHIRNFNYGGVVYTPLSIDTYGNAEAQRKLFNQLNEGTMILTYFGHGAEQFLGKDRFFFSAGDVYKLRNSFPPLVGFAGCQITNSDRGYRGLGETIVTATPYGCIGSIVSARETWSGQNMEFFKSFFTNMYLQGPSISSKHLTEPRTIGEVYAKVKSYSTYTNELAYQLLCDPMLVIPTIIQDVKLDNGVDLKAVPGEKFTVSGTVLNASGQTDTNYNGQVVIRLNEPTQIIGCGNIESKENPGSLAYTYRDAQISMGVGDVKNGVFTVEFHCPANTSAFTGQKANLFVGAYNHATKSGAGRGFEVEVAASPSAGSAESRDVISPTIEEFSFNHEDCSIQIKVSDNVALNLSDNPLSKGLYLYIDGKERSEAHFCMPIVEPDRAAYSKNVAIDGLTYGEHTAGLKVKDAAGNATMTEFKFTYAPLQAAYSIALADESDNQRAVIVADGDIPATAMLHVLSPSGMIVWSGQFTNGRTEWNLSDLSGARVAPGHYKAYIIETGKHATKGHSETIDIPVI